MKKYLFVFIAFFSSFLAFPKSFDWDCQFGLGLGATFSRTRFSVADDFGCGDAEAGGASLDFLNVELKRLLNFLPVNSLWAPTFLHIAPLAVVGGFQVLGRMSWNELSPDITRKSSNCTSRMAARR